MSCCSPICRHYWNKHTYLIQPCVCLTGSGSDRQPGPTGCLVTSRLQTHSLWGPSNTPGLSLPICGMCGLGTQRNSFYAQGRELGWLFPERRPGSGLRQRSSSASRCISQETLEGAEPPPPSTRCPVPSPQLHLPEGTPHHLSGRVAMNLYGQQRKLADRPGLSGTGQRPGSIPLRGRQDKELSWRRAPPGQKRGNELRSLKSRGGPWGRRK